VWVAQLGSHVEPALHTRMYPCTLSVDTRGSARAATLGVSLHSCLSMMLLQVFDCHMARLLGYMLAPYLKSWW
jgi:hypothetical protein